LFSSGIILDVAGYKDAAYTLYAIGSILSLATLPLVAADLALLVTSKTFIEMQVARLLVTVWQRLSFDSIRKALVFMARIPELQPIMFKYAISPTRLSYFFGGNLGQAEQLAYFLRQALLQVLRP
jgi:hypothetical protein